MLSGIIIFIIFISSAAGKHPATESAESNEIFNLDSVNIKQFLGMISGTIKIGNHTIKLPQDLPKLIRGNEVASQGTRRSSTVSSSSERSLRHNYGPFGSYTDGKTNYYSHLHQNRREDGFDHYFGKDGWGWGSQEERKPGLISVANFFRLGCVLFDLAEIKESAQNGLF